IQYCFGSSAVDAIGAGLPCIAGAGAGGGATEGRSEPRRGGDGRVWRRRQIKPRDGLGAGVFAGANARRHVGILETTVVKIAVIGTGYVGLVTGTCLAESGNDVVGIDKDRQKIETLEAGRLPIYEPGLLELVQRNRREDRLHFTSDLAQGI